MKTGFWVPAVCKAGFCASFKDEFGCRLEDMEGYEESSFYSGGESWVNFSFENPGDVGSAMVAFANGFIRGRESCA